MKIYYAIVFAHLAVPLAGTRKNNKTQPANKSNGALHIIHLPF